MNTYAIVETGSKQYRVQAGDRIRVESLPVYTGEILNIDDVLMVSREGDVTVGTPVVSGARVRAQVTSRGRGKKITVFKYKSKVRYRRKKGHRQAYTDLRIIDISLDGESLAAVEEQEESTEVLDEVEETLDSVDDAADESETSEKATEYMADEEETVAAFDQVDETETDEADEQDDASEPEAVEEPGDSSEAESVEESSDTDEVKEAKDGA